MWYFDWFMLGGTWEFGLIIGFVVETLAQSLVLLQRIIHTNITGEFGETGRVCKRSRTQASCFPGRAARVCPSCAAKSSPKPRSRDPLHYGFS